MTEPTAEASWQPAGQRMIDNPEAIKAIADPLRVRILQLLMVAADRTWSVKEIAAELNQPVTKLYHHVKLLEGAALITDVDTRVVSGIVEHRYRASQKSLRLDDSLFSSPATRHDTIEQVSAMLDSTRDDLLDYLYRDDADFDRVSISKSSPRLTDDELAELNQTVEEMVTRYQANRDDPDRHHLPRTSVMVLINPLGHDPS